ncbi:Mu transposase domain-containing protein [Streptomyces sp. NPDC050287]|uniref:Mu transposase domain-containing protein n=1 Tax=Streptomyces sp. NPDC050287 TaxID=3365608 RepID=UPI00378C7EF6
MDAHALRRQGWTIPAIARHLGRDRKTIRAYLNGEQVPGLRHPSPDAFVPFLDYCRQRLADDPHLWASTLFDEVSRLGYEGGYSTFTRALRRYQVRPHCEPWVAKYYGVGVDICPPRRGNRKGVVEKANHSAAQRWWRTVPDALTVFQAQSGIDKLSVRMDERRRVADGLKVTVGELAAAEPLLDIPVRPFPAELEAERTVSPQSLVSFDGNFYSVPPSLAGAQVRVVHRLGEDYLHIVTAGRAVVAQHRRAPRGAGQTIRDAGHVIALERAVLASFSDRAPCKTKVRRPPSQAALAEAERLRGRAAAADPAERVVIDLSHYAAVADRLRTAPNSEEENTD